MLNVVMVIDCTDKENVNFDSIKAFPDTTEGNKKAEKIFRELVKEASYNHAVNCGDPKMSEATDEDIDMMLDDGIYELGDGYIAITHSC